MDDSCQAGSNCGASAGQGVGAGMDASLQRLYETAIKQVDLAYWRWSFAEEKLTHFSENYAAVDGHVDGVARSYEDMLVPVHEDDKTRVLQTYLDADRGPSDFDVTYRVIDADGKVRWLHERAEVEFNAQGDAIAHLGVVQDITRQKQSEVDLRERETLYQSLVELSPSAVLVHKWGEIVFANVAAAKCLGAESSDALIGTHLLDFIAPPIRHIVKERIDSMMLHGAVAGLMEQRIIRADRKEVYVESAAAPISYQGEPAALVVFSDITERKNTEFELRSAKRDADVASVTKSEFLATMSHELRTPLNAIIGFSNMIMEQIFGPIGNDKYADYIGNIRESGEHLLELINDILDVSAIEAGKLEIHEENIDIRQLMETTIRLAGPRASKKNIEVAAILQDPVPTLYADERRTKQILLNLLSNAVKFSYSGGDVSIEVRTSDDGALAFVISDQGLGMDEQEVATAMEAFGQIGSVHTSNFEGTGLGLSLTKSLLELHEGELIIESEKGVGTQVTARFPKSRISSAG